MSEIVKPGWEQAYEEGLFFIPYKKVYGKHRLVAEEFYGVLYKWLSILSSTSMTREQYKSFRKEFAEENDAWIFGVKVGMCSSFEECVLAICKSFFAKEKDLETLLKNVKELTPFLKKGTTCSKEFDELIDSFTQKIEKETAAKIAQLNAEIEKLSFFGTSFQGLKNK
jgi:hypothetical protein